MRREKNGYRLPLETEWEYAARGGSVEHADWNLSYAGSDNPDDIAWYEANAPHDGGAHPAGTMTFANFDGASIMFRRID